MKRLWVLICILVTILFGIHEKDIIVSKWALNNELNIDKERTLGVSHFFMMGLNEESIGSCCEEDVKYSKLFMTNKERDAACLAVAKGRMEDMGILGILEHSSKKLISSLADSSFGYKVLHLGRVKDVSDKGEISLVLRSWLRSDGKYYTILSMFRQILWGIVLFFSLGNWKSIFIKCEGQSNEEFAVELTIIGFLLFEVLFESNCRHILSMVSVFILSGAIGFRKICTNNW